MAAMIVRVPLHWGHYSYKSLSINAVFRSLTTIKSWEWLSGKGEAQKDKESRLELWPSLACD
jgi:hypothetical protein